MSQWFRAYSEALNDPKIQTLPLDAFKAWHNALYLAASMSSRDGNIGTLDDVSFAFRETKDSVSSAFHTLIERGLLVTVGETFQVTKWSKRQYKSDVSTERVRQHRKRSKSVTETAPETETDNTLSKDKDEAVDSRKVFWDSSKAYLGKSKAGMIGKWASKYGQEATAKAITAAQLAGAVDPVPYVEKVLRGSKSSLDNFIA